MRKLAMILCLVAPMLGGCATTAGNGNGQEIIYQVQAYARDICAFIPTVATVAEIMATGTYTSAFITAQAICSAIAPPPGVLRAARGTPRVNGVPIRGRFV